MKGGYNALMENHMKKLLLTLTLFATLVLGSGCATLQNWWDQFKSNPVEYVQTFEQGVQVAISDATIAFQIIVQYLPANVQVQAQTDFDNAVVSVNHALTALSDAVQAAMDAQQPNPDFTALITAVTSAVQQVIAIINQYTNAPPAPPSAIAALPPRPTSPPGLADAQAILSSLQSRYGVKPAAAAVKK
jgi:hypothetical protein